MPLNINNPADDIYIAYLDVMLLDMDIFTLSLSIVFKGCCFK